VTARKEKKTKKATVKAAAQETAAKAVVVTAEKKLKKDKEVAKKKDEKAMKATNDEIMTKGEQKKEAKQKAAMAKALAARKAATKAEKKVKGDEIEKRIKATKLVEEKSAKERIMKSNKVKLKVSDNYDGALAPTTFDGLKYRTAFVSSINYDPEIGAHWGGKNLTDSFAAEFTGNLEVLTAGFYTFYTKSVDGSVLYVNGKAVVTNDGTHKLKETSGPVVLEKGLANIRVMYFKGRGGNPALTVSYEGPGVIKQHIPGATFEEVPNNCAAGERSVQFPLGGCEECSEGTYSVNGATSCSDCWEKATTDSLGELFKSSKSSTKFMYLFANDKGWIISPASILRWSWGSFQKLEGQWEVALGTERNTVTCLNSTDQGTTGVGCSRGEGKQAVFVQSNSSKPAEGTAVVCSTPAALGSANCAEATVYVRKADALRGEIQMEAAMKAIPWIASGVCAQGPVLNTVWQFDESNRSPTLASLKKNPISQPYTPPSGNMVVQTEPEAEPESEPEASDDDDDGDGDSSSSSSSSSTLIAANEPIMASDKHSPMMLRNLAAQALSFGDSD